MPSFQDLYTEAAFDDLLAGGTNPLGEEFPFLPLPRPGPLYGKPPPAPLLVFGPDFLAEALTMSGRPTGSPKQMERAALVDPGTVRYANWMYYRALWDPTFTLTVRSKKGPSTVPLLLGHLWGCTPDGPRQARVVVVGKGPGIDEMRGRRNFCGPTGEEFCRALGAVGLTEATTRDWYLTNVARFANPNAYLGTNVYETAHVKDCLPLLWQELALVRPEWVLCLGREAAIAVLGKDTRVSDAVGRVFELPVPLHHQGEEPRSHQARAMVVLHPAAVLHTPERRDDLLKGLQRFAEQLAGVPADYRDPEADREHIAVRTMAEWQPVYQRLRAEAPAAWALDLEWQGRFPTEDDSRVETLQFSWADKKACLLELYGDAAAPLLIAKWDHLRRDLERLWTGRRIVGHNLASDLPWLLQLGLGVTYDQFIDQPEDDDERFGWEKTDSEGGFDTMLAAHAHNETALYSLKELALKHTTAPRWDVEVEECIRQHCREQKIPRKRMTGFGFVPHRILVPYALYDPDITFRLYTAYNRPGGLLDADQYGNCSREPFWRAMRAFKAFLECHLRGMTVDLAVAEKVRRVFGRKSQELLEEVRRELAWPEFNSNSHLQCAEALFGEQYLGGDRRRPEGARSLGLFPYKSTGKKAKLWDEIAEKGLEHAYKPAVDKEVLSILVDEAPVVRTLRDLRFVEQVGKAVLKKPTEEVDLASEEVSDGLEYEEGLLSYVMKDGRVHTNYSQTKETGRASSWQPPLHNLSARRDADYRRILGDAYVLPVRAVLKAAPGHLFVEADFTMAELYMAAVQSGDEAMIEACESVKLPEEDPRHRDVHSLVAIGAFKLAGPDGTPLRPTKGDLARAGYAVKRDIAKPIVFGKIYDMTPETALRRVREEGVDATPDDVAALFESLDSQFVDLEGFLVGAGDRSQDPGWLATCFNRLRRSAKVYDRKAVEGQRREFRNMVIQGGIADCTNEAMHNLWAYRAQHGKGPRSKTRWFWFVHQIHDALMFEVPIGAVEWVVKEVVPVCMSEQIDIWPCYLDGDLREDPRAPYHLGVEVKVYEHYGLKLKDAELADRYDIHLGS